MQTKLNTFKQIAETIAAVVVIIGILLFFYEDYKTTKRAQFSATYDLYVLFQSNDYNSIRYGLVAPFTKYNLHKLKAAHPPKQVTDKFIIDIVEKNEETFKSLYALDQFVNGLEICIEADVCNKKAAHDLFGKFISDAYCLYNPAFPKLADKLQMKEFGQSIKRFADVKRQCS